VSDRFPALRSRGGDLALPAAGVTLFVAVVALVLGATRQPGIQMLVLCTLAAILGAAGALLLLWGLAYRRLSYALTETALRIEWFGRTLVLPYSAIQGIYAGQRLSGSSTPSVPRWPGINVGPRRVRGLGRLRFFATSSDQSHLTFVTVEHGGVVMSAGQPTEFQTALIEHVEASPEDDDAQLRGWQDREPVDAPWTALADIWLPVCIGVGTVLLLAILAIISLRYDVLPDQVPLHFDVGGQPSQIAPKSDLMRLPLLSLVCLVVNWTLGIVVHPRERILARLLWLSAVIVQPVLLIGVLAIATWTPLS
jgi:hypothetical protein